MTGTPAACVRRWTARCSRCRTTRWGSPLRRSIPGAAAAPPPTLRTWRAWGSAGPATRTAPPQRSRQTPPLPNGGRALFRAQPPVYRCPLGVVQWPQRQPRISRVLCRACPHPPAATRTPWSNTMRPAIRRPRLSLSAMSSPAPLWMGLSPARRILTAASKRSK